MAKKKVLILGGGVGAMTAAYQLAKTEELRDQYELSVYQMGWRIGGKGASGRNMEPKYGHRIEEHGLHIWMGFYENAFTMMREIYPLLNRPPGAPLATVEDAFKPHQLITLFEQVDDRWYKWPYAYPEYPGYPGDSGPPIWWWDIVRNLIYMLRKIFEDFLGSHGNNFQPTDLHASWIRRAIEHVEGDVEVVTLREQLARAEANALTVKSEAPHEQADTVKKVVDDLVKFRQRFHDNAGADLEAHIPTRRIWYLFDIGITTIKGMWEDGLFWPDADWEKLDKYEWREWFAMHGMDSATLVCPVIRAIYDLVFGYVDGVVDWDHANLAAGSTLRGVMRMVLGYKGSIFYKMQAGMGDTIFTPFYQLLHDRYGVPFNFFHRVREVIPTADGKSIDSVVIGVQATLANGVSEYHPLVDVNDLPCWPSTPLYDQLEQGKKLEKDNVNLESYWSDWPDVKTITLKKGVDFDYVVFGLSLGAVPVVCPKLVTANANWKNMVDYVGTVRTQAFQLWLKPDIQQMGWISNQRAVVGTFVEPLDTWADMSQLLVREDWEVGNPPSEVPKNIAYFCGPLVDMPPNPPFSDTKFPDVMFDDVKLRSFGFCEKDIHHLWPNATPSSKIKSLDWNLLVDPEDRRSVERFDAQFFRANIDPTERYVLSLKGATQYRLTPDDTGFDNLFAAGDWTHNGLNVGCVEAAVMGGMMAVKKLIPGLVIWGDPDQKPPLRVI